MPLITRATCFGASLAARSVRRRRSIATIWDTFATESFGSPVSFVGRRTLPGASAHARLLVSGTQTTVAILLRFMWSPWTTITGRRKPGSEPLGSARSASRTTAWYQSGKFERFPIWRVVLRARCMKGSESAICAVKYDLVRSSR